MKGIDHLKEIEEEEENEIKMIEKKIKEEDENIEIDFSKFNDDKVFED